MESSCEMEAAFHQLVWAQRFMPPAVGMTTHLGGWRRVPAAELSSRPERTRISCHAELDKDACAPFREERRMKCVNATKINRKSGGSGGTCCFPSD